MWNDIKVLFADNWNGLWAFVGLLLTGAYILRPILDKFVPKAAKHVEDAVK